MHKSWITSTHASGKEQRKRRGLALRKPQQQPCKVARKRGKRQATTRRKDKLLLVLQVRRIRRNNSLKKIQALWLN